MHSRKSLSCGLVGKRRGAQQSGRKHPASGGRHSSNGRLATPLATANRGWAVQLSVPRQFTAIGRSDRVTKIDSPPAPGPGSGSSPLQHPPKPILPWPVPLLLSRRWCVNVNLREIHPELRPLKSARASPTRSCPATSVHQVTFFAFPLRSQISPNKHSTTENITPIDTVTSKSHHTRNHVFVARPAQGHWHRCRLRLR